MKVRRWDRWLFPSLQPNSLSAALTNNMYGFNNRSLTKYFKSDPSLSKLRGIILTTEKKMQEPGCDSSGYLKKVIEKHCREYDVDELACHRSHLIRFARSFVRSS